MERVSDGIKATTLQTLNTNNRRGYFLAVRKWNSQVLFFPTHQITAQLSDLSTVKYFIVQAL